MQASKHYTEDYKAADVLFVYDYCYTTWHASVAFGGNNGDGSEPAGMVQQAYQSLAFSDLCAAAPLLSALHVTAVEAWNTRAGSWKARSTRMPCSKRKAIQHRLLLN